MSINLDIPDDWVDIKVTGCDGCMPVNEQKWRQKNRNTNLQETLSQKNHNPD